MTGNYSEIHKDLIEQSKKGDSKAQFQLYKHYMRAMFNICCRMLNNRTDAEDMLQDCFSEAFANLHHFRYESSFGAWLKRIVINRCINSLKRRKAELVYFEDLHTVDRTDSDNDEKIQYDVNKIHRAIEQLSDGYRVVFSLYMLEGYDHAEIAEIMGISESTSKSQYLRAKKKLKELLISEDKLKI